MKGLVNKLWYDLYHIYLYHEIPINSNWYLILATQETEIRRIMVRSQLRANSSWRLISKKTLHQKKKKKGGGWWRGSRCRSWVQTPVHKKKKKKKKKNK
jgi:hypothetical protein